MDRIILHSDLNNFYASVECLYAPELRGIPFAVAGDPAVRHGIVLAKNELAKRRGVQTGDALWQAEQKCPGIRFVRPHHSRYAAYSKAVQEIYAAYTDRVQPFGLDECWLDVTGSTGLFGDGPEIAAALRARIHAELGLTASVGVSFNKVFAKLGSDLKKPDATTAIPRAHFQEIVWPLPAGALLFAGRATCEKLGRYCIHTIGDLAASDEKFLRRLLGKNGVTLWNYANGRDTSPVTAIGDAPEIKSIGNSTTTPWDLTAAEDIRAALYLLCESVSTRLREKGYLCRTVQLGVRDDQLLSYERQGALAVPARNTEALFEKAFSLFRDSHPRGKPVRALSVRACSLLSEKHEQLSLFPGTRHLQKQESLDAAVDAVRARFGHDAVQRGLFLSRSLAELSRGAGHLTAACSFLPV